MKKLLILGGAHILIPAINKAKELGYHVIICDEHPNPPGKEIAHEYYNVSTTDKEAVLTLAKTLNIDGIIPYASDTNVTIAAYVAEQLGLPTHPYESVKILTNKELFRKFLMENGFSTPKARGYNSLEEAYEDFHHFNMPVMIKPVDSSGSRGVSKIYSFEELPNKVANALHFSKVKKFIIEEFIETYGSHIGGDGFSINGQLVFRAFSNEYFPTPTSPNPFVPIVTTWPCHMPKHIQSKIHNEIQRALTLLNMKDGPYNFDIKVDAEENVYLIELTARNGGDWNPEAICCATKIDLIEYTIKAALGEDCGDLKMIEPDGFVSTYLFTSNKGGTFKGVHIHEEIKSNIVEYEILVKEGDIISPLYGANNKLGIALFKFSSLDEMNTKLSLIHKLVNVIVE